MLLVFRLKSPALQQKVPRVRYTLHLSSTSKRTFPSGGGYGGRSAAQRTGKGYLTQGMSFGLELVHANANTGLCISIFQFRSNHGVPFQVCGGRSLCEDQHSARQCAWAPYFQRSHPWCHEPLSALFLGRPDPSGLRGPGGDNAQSRCCEELASPLAIPKHPNSKRSPFATPFPAESRDASSDPNRPR